MLWSHSEFTRETPSAVQRHIYVRGIIVGQAWRKLWLIGWMERAWGDEGGGILRLPTLIIHRQPCNHHPQRKILQTFLNRRSYHVKWEVSLLQPQPYWTAIPTPPFPAREHSPYIYGKENHTGRRQRGGCVEAAMLTTGNQSWEEALVEDREQEVWPR